MGSVETALQTSSAAVNTVIDDAVQAAGQFATAAARGFENSVFGSLTKEIMTGDTGKNLLSQWGFGALRGVGPGCSANPKGFGVPDPESGGNPLFAWLSHALT